MNYHCCHQNGSYNSHYHSKNHSRSKTAIQKVDQLMLFKMVATYCIFLFQFGIHDSIDNLGRISPSLYWLTYWLPIVKHSSHDRTNLCANFLLKMSKFLRNSHTWESIPTTWPNYLSRIIINIDISSNHSNFYPKIAWPAQNIFSGSEAQPHI